MSTSPYPTHYHPYGATYAGQGQPYQYSQYYQQSQSQPQPQQSQASYPYPQPSTSQYNPDVPFPIAHTNSQSQPISGAPRQGRPHTPHPSRRRTSAAGGSRAERHGSTSGHGSHSGHGSNAGHQPLRSALKKKVERSHTTAAVASMPSITRARTHSGATDTQPRVDGIARSRTMSNVRIDPDHLFLSIQPPNTLELSNIAFQATVDELRAHVFPMWPRGIDHQESFGHHWRVKFTGRPFSSTGHDGILMQRMVCKIFWVLSNHGYVYLTSINTGRAFHAPRLVFIRAPSDPGTAFFSMTLSDSGDSVVFVDPHDVVTQSLGLALRSAFPRSVTTDTLMDDNILRIQLRTTFNGLGIDKNLFLAVILKHINDVMIKLDASVPLGRKGLFGLGSRRELWIFKGSASWWEKNGRR